MALVEKTTQGWNSLLRDHALVVALTMCGNLNNVNSRDNSPQLTLCFTWKIKKGGFTPLLANHKKGIFPLKRAFLGESQRLLR